MGGAKGTVNTGENDAPGGNGANGRTLSMVGFNSIGGGGAATSGCSSSNGSSATCSASIGGTGGNGERVHLASAHHLPTTQPTNQPS